MVLRNYLSLAGAEVVSKIVTFAAFAYMARVTGPEGFGSVEFAGAVLLCAGLVVDQGFGPYGAREIAKAPQATADLVSEIVFARLLLAVASYVVMILLAGVLDRPAEITRLLLVYGASLLATPWLLQWVFQGHDRMAAVAATQVIRQTVFAVVVFAGVRDAAHLVWAGVAEIAAVCTAAAFSVWMYRRLLGGVLRVQPRLSARLFRDAVPIGVSQMLWVARMFGGTLILGTIAPVRDVGLFASALRILVAMHAFVWLYYFNLLPSLARAWQQGATAFAALVHRSMRAVTWVAVPAGVVWVVAARTIITAAYGEAFAPASAALQWFAAVCVMAVLSGHYRFGLIAAGRQTEEMATAACGAVVGLPLVPLGYRAVGPTGAAVALCVAEAAVWGSAWWLARRGLGLARGGEPLLRGSVRAVQPDTRGR